jgi:hypothetical protein
MNKSPRHCKCLSARSKPCCIEPSSSSARRPGNDTKCQQHRLSVATRFDPTQSARRVFRCGDATNSTRTKTRRPRRARARGNGQGRRASPGTRAQQPQRRLATDRLDCCCHGSHALVASCLSGRRTSVDICWAPAKTMACAGRVSCRHHSGLHGIFARQSNTLSRCMAIISQNCY